MILYENHLGAISVSKEYLTQLVVKTVTGCFGVAGISDRKPTLPSLEWLNLRKGDARGVTLRYVKKKLEVELHILASYGVNLTEIVRSIIGKVRYTLEEAAGCKVAHVRVFVDGIKM